MMNNDASVDQTKPTMMTCEEFREKYRVSVGKLPNGDMVEVVAVQITNDNYHTIPSMSAFRKFLWKLYSRGVYVIYESHSAAECMIFFKWPNEQ